MSEQQQGAEEARVINGRPEGQLDWSLHDLIHEKIATDGYDEARQFIAVCLNDFNSRLARRANQ